MTELNASQGAPQSAAGKNPGSATPTTPAPTAAPKPDGLPVRDKASSLLIGNLCMLVAAIFWGLNVSVTKALFYPVHWMTPDSIVVVRLIGGAALFWLASAFIRCESIQKEDWLKVVLGGVVGLFGFIYLFITSLKFGSAIDISIIMTLPPIFVILIGVIFLHRRPGWMEYAGVAVSFIGAAIVILGGANPSAEHKAAASNPILGDILAIASTICYAFYLTILEGPTKKYKPVALLRWIFLFSAIPTLFLLRHFDHIQLWHATKALPWVYIGFILLCPTFIAYFLVQPAMKRIGSELVSIYQYMLPVFATISAIFMLGEKLHWVQVIAMIVIVVGMLFTTFGKRRRVKKEGQDDV